MEAIYQQFLQYDQFAEQYRNSELARIDYSLLKWTDTLSIRKIIRSLLYQSLVYEKTLTERLITWFQAPSGEGEGEVLISLPGSDPLLLLRTLDAKGNESLMWRKRLLVSQTILNLAPCHNFLSVYYLGTELTDVARYYGIVGHGSQLPAGPTIIEQAIYGNKLVNILDDMDPNTLINILFQIAFAVAYVNKRSDKRLFLSKLYAADIVIVDTDIAVLDYGDYGRLNTNGKLAIITNYDNFEGKIVIGKTAYSLPLKEDLQGAEKNPLAYLAVDLVHLIQAEKMPQFHIILRSLGGKLYQTTIHDTPIKLEEEFATIQGPMTTNIALKDIGVPIFLPQGGYEGLFSQVRMVYAGALVRDNPGVILEINALQKRLERMCIEASRLVRKNDKNGVRLGYAVLASLSSLWRLLVTILPYNPATVAMRKFVNINISALRGREKKMGTALVAFPEQLFISEEEALVEGDI